MACPDSDCHTKVNETCKLVHSAADGLPSKVSKSYANKWAIAILGFAVSIIIVVALAWGAAKDERKQNKQDVAVVKESITRGFERMFDKLDDLEKSQITFQDVHDAITRRINK